MRRQFSEELDAHVMDASAELVKLGYTEAAARTEAIAQFGDRKKIEQELAALHPWLSSYVDVIVAVVFVLSIAPLFILHWLAPTSTVGLVSEELMLWWWFGTAIIGVALLLAWMLDVVGLSQRLGIIFGAAWITEAALTITAMMDANNFETAIDNIWLILLGSAVLASVWSQLSNWLKRAGLFAIAALAIAGALSERVLFPMLHRSCQFIFGEHLVASCTRITLLDPQLWPIYAAIIACAGCMGWYVSLLWVSASALHRKVITTLACLLLPVLAVTQPNFNKLGDVDVIPWKRDIYATYQEILGRDPQPKDIEFYTMTHAYQHMSRVREVLFKSEERRIKINLLYQAALQRDATTAELDHYANGYLSISEITAELANPLTRFISN